MADKDLNEQAAQARAKAEFERALQDAIAYARQHLVPNHPSVEETIATIENITLPSGIRQRLATELISLVAGRRNDPCVSLAPAPLITGDLRLGPQADGTIVGLRWGEPQMHGNINGPSGSGKTTLATNLAEAILTTPQPDGRVAFAVIPDYKRDYERVALRHHLLVLHARSDLNLIAVPPWEDQEEFDLELTESWGSSTYGAVNVKGIFLEALQRAREQRPDANLEDVGAILVKMEKKSDPWSRRQAIHQNWYRYHGVKTALAGLVRSRNNAWPTIVQSSVYVPMEDNAAYDLLGLTLLRVQFRHHKRFASAYRNTLSHWWLMDEASLNWDARIKNIDGVPLMSSTHMQSRELGIGFTIVTSSLHQLDSTLLGNTFYFLSLGGTGLDADLMARITRLPPEKREYLHRVMTRRGQCLLTLSGRYKEPVLFQFTPHPELQRKDVAPNEWAGLLRSSAERLEQTMTSTPPPLAAQPALPSSSPVPPQALSNRVLPMPAFAEALLKRKCQFLEPITISYAAIGASPEEGDRAKNYNITVGCFEATPVRIVFRGGTGGAGYLYLVTKAGYDRAGMKPLATTGGGPQHDYCVFMLEQRIPGFSRETTIGTNPGKRCDGIIRITLATQERFIKVIHELSGQTLSEGQLVALEVETSVQPSKAVSLAINNWEKNYQASIDRTLSLVMPKNVKAVIAALAAVPPALQQTVIVLDVLRVIDALRKEQ